MNDLRTPLHYTNKHHRLGIYKFLIKASFSLKQNKYQSLR